MQKYGRSKWFSVASRYTVGNGELLDRFDDLVFNGMMKVSVPKNYWNDPCEKWKMRRDISFIPPIFFGNSLYLMVNDSIRRLLCQSLGLDYIQFCPIQISEPVAIRRELFSEDVLLSAKLEEFVEKFPDDNPIKEYFKSIPVESPHGSIDNSIFQVLVPSNIRMPPEVNDHSIINASYKIELPVGKEEIQIPRFLLDHYEFFYCVTHIVSGQILDRLMPFLDTRFILISEIKFEDV